VLKVRGSLLFIMVDIDTSLFLDDVSGGDVLFVLRCRAVEGILLVKPLLLDAVGVCRMVGVLLGCELKKFILSCCAFYLIIVIDDFFSGQSMMSRAGSSFFWQNAC
jgi:hypothetical protein